MMKEDYFYQLIEHYRKALQIKPNNLAIYNQLAELYYKQGELEKTLEICQKALQIQSDLMLVSTVLYQILQKLGFKEKEIETLQKGIQDNLGEVVFYELLYINSKAFTSSKVFTIADVTTWKEAIILGHTLKEKKQWDEAIYAYLKAIEIEPALSLPHVWLHHIITYCTSLESGQLEEINKLFIKSIQGRSTPYYAYLLLGDMLTKQSKIVEAIDAYKLGIYKTIRLNERYPIKSISSIQHYQINFLIIGSGKSGTTALYYYLCKHPKFIPPLQKELDFFNSNLELGLDWYLAHFPPLPNEGGFFTGEATPWYFGQYGVAEKVFQLFPNMKLILILRNPISRAISHYYMSLKIKEYRSLETAIYSELEILNDLKDPLQVSEKYWDTERGYLWFGLYFYFLEKWMALFPREQLLILRSEDLYNQTAKTMQQVYEFLEIPDYPLPDYPKYNSSSYPNVNLELRQKLSDFFHPHNQKLENYLGMKFDWR